MNKFTILGETGSGKTCYLLGMYFEMTMGVAGYNILTPNHDEDKNLTLRYSMLNDKKRGASRFPAPSDSVQKYNFKLQYAFKTILPFEWVDYPGGYLDPATNAPDSEQYKQVSQNIKESSTLFICIDGENLCGSDTEMKINNVRRNSALYIVPYLGRFEGKLPPIAMVITKYDLCKNDTNPSEIKEIIEEVFTGLFLRDDVFVAIIPVSLGATLQDDNCSGELEPLNVHLPILMGINFALIDEMEAARRLIRSIDNDISIAQRYRDKEADRFSWFRDDDYIYRKEKEIAASKEEQERIRSNAKYFKSSLAKVNQKMSAIDMIFANGVWQDNKSIHRMWEKLQSVTKHF